jgi:HD-GYP domain-containing protein (c-di-GMP phosphodiesterase class II)
MAIRRSEFFMALAYATDLATGQSHDFAIRSCALAMKIAEHAHLDVPHRRNVFHQALLRYIGCNADTYMMSAIFGDEIAFRRDFARIDNGNRAEIGEVVIRAVRRALAGASPDEVARAIEHALGQGMAASIPILAGHCEVAERIGVRLGLDADICTSLGQLYERWDGHGLPQGLKGNEISLAVRIVTLAQDALVLNEAHGSTTMRSMIAARRAGAYDPDLADIFQKNTDEIMAFAAHVDRDAVLALEPEPHAMINHANIEEAYLVLADMVDMRMPFTTGHSRAVADLAGLTAKALGLPENDILALRCAGLAHDIGELSVPVGTWMRPGPLTALETDAARLHPYHGERILIGFDPKGLGIAALVCRHHERLDGSGYHRGVRGPDLSLSSRILAVAEAFQTAREPRAHRTAFSDVSAANRLRDAARCGTLDAQAVEALLAVVGQATRRASSHASNERHEGLTPREIEVLRLIASGNTAKEAARALNISPKTADNHIQSLYAKIGVKTRAGAVLFAMERGFCR